MDATQEGLIRALCFYDASGYAPTRIELLTGLDHKSNEEPVETLASLQTLTSQGAIVETRGRLTFPAHISLVLDHEAREAWLPRKLRRARQVAYWLARVGGVRFVALCNTTALAHAREASDLDFFIIVSRGALWQTRGWATLPFKLLGVRPRPEATVRDAVCLSFFVDDSALDLSSLQLSGDDVYLRHWFLSLLPLYDDGVSSDLWQANHQLLARHPCAVRWINHPEIILRPPHFRLPFFSALEAPARVFQTARFPVAIQTRMNQDSRVVVNDHVLKFHVDDGREKFRAAYRENCQRYEVEA